MPNMHIPKNPHSHQFIRFLRMGRDGMGRGGIIRGDGGGTAGDGRWMTGGGAEIGTCATVLSIAPDGTVASEDC